MPWDGRVICVAPEFSFSNLLLSHLEFDEEGMAIFCSNSPLSTPPSTPASSPTITPPSMPEMPEHLFLSASSLSDFSSGPNSSNSSTTPLQTCQMTHAKRQSKANRKVKRRSERALAKEGQSIRDYKPRPNIGRNHIKGHQPLKTTFDRRKFTTTDTAYTGLRGNNSATEYPLEVLVGPDSRFKMEYIKWKGE